MAPCHVMLPYEWPFVSAFDVMDQDGKKTEYCKSTILNLAQMKQNDR